MKTYKTFMNEIAKWRKYTKLTKKPDWYDNEGGSDREDYDFHKPKKHDGGEPKQSVADTKNKYGSLQNRPKAGQDYSTIKKDGKLSKRGVDRLKARIKARND